MTFFLVGCGGWSGCDRSHGRDLAAPLIAACTQEAHGPSRPCGCDDGQRRTVRADGGGRAAHLSTVADTWVVVTIAFGVAALIFGLEPGVWPSKPRRHRNRGAERAVGSACSTAG